MDLTKLTDKELETWASDALREQSRRKNIAGFPVAKQKADDALANFPKAALAITTEEDDIDGEYVVVDVGDNDDLMGVLLADGGIFKSAGKVRIHANRAVKEGGHFAKLEAAL